jgi:hypothetical protein
MMHKKPGRTLLIGLFPLQLYGEIGKIKNFWPKALLNNGKRAIGVYFIFAPLKKIRCSTNEPR